MILLSTGNTTTRQRATTCKYINKKISEGRGGGVERAFLSGNTVLIPTERGILPLIAFLSVFWQRQPWCRQRTDDADSTHKATRMAVLPPRPAGVLQGTERTPYPVTRSPSSLITRPCHKGQPLGWEERKSFQAYHVRASLLKLRDPSHLLTPQSHWHTWATDSYSRFLNKTRSKVIRTDFGTDRAKQLHVVTGQTL